MAKLWFPELTPSLPVGADPITILRAVAQAIHDEPKRYDQGIWLQTDAYPASDQYYPACGTVGCIAGWIVVLTRRPGDPYIPLNVADVAADRLGLGYDEVRQFFNGGAVDLRHTRTDVENGWADPVEHARQGVEHIRRFLATKFGYTGPVLKEEESNA